MRPGDLYYSDRYGYVILIIEGKDGALWNVVLNDTAGKNPNGPARLGAAAGQVLRDHIHTCSYECVGNLSDMIIDILKNK